MSQLRDDTPGEVVWRSQHALAIGLIGPLPPPSGGMANQTRQLARLLTDAGIQVALVQVNAPYRPAWVGSIRGVRAVFRLVPYLARLWACAGKVDLFHVMANSGWAWHLFAAPAVVVAWLRRKPVILNYRGGNAERFLRQQFALIRPIIALSEGIAVPSTFLQEVFARHGVKAVIVPNIVDLSRFRPASTQPEGAPHVLVTRNLEEIYDIGTALRAFAEIVERYPGARLSVAGSGPKRASLERLAGALGLSDAVRFTGRLDNEELPALYRSAQLLLNPSTVDNTPISLLEAMASGVPIVSTDVGGIPHLVHSEITALLVPARDPAKMAHAAMRILGDPQLAARLRTAGSERVQEFTWIRASEGLFRLYSEALGRAIHTGTAT